MRIFIYLFFFVKINIFFSFLLKIFFFLNCFRDSDNLFPYLIYEKKIYLLAMGYALKKI